jgi:hypothetical protein
VVALADEPLAPDEPPAPDDDIAPGATAAVPGPAGSITAGLAMADMAASEEPVTIDPAADPAADLATGDLDALVAVPVDPTVDEDQMQLFR